MTYFTLKFWQDFWQDALKAVVAHGLRLLFILLIYLLARQVIFRIIDAALARLMSRQAHTLLGEERSNRLRTLQGLTKSVVGYILFFVFAMMVLQALTVDITSLITTAGVGGIAIGFGAQKLVKDVISGFFIITEDQFGVGDYVTIGTASGVVEDVGMRITRIRDDMGRLWILSNGDITIVTNHSRAPIEAFIEVGVAPTADVKKAEAAINAVGEELLKSGEHGLLKAPKALGVSAYDAAKTTIRVAIVAEPKALAAEQLRVREAILQRLTSEGIPVA
jgi:small-conductance mechanosensitive channel